MSEIESTEAPADEENGFALLNLDPRLVETLGKLGYEEPTPIQKQAIPILLAGRDVVGQAATGTGKSAAFALPLLQRLAAMDKRPSPAALVLVPTRELAMQVAEAMNRYSQALRLSVIPIYGGQAFDQQLRALKRGVDVVVATPGRAMDHVRRGTIKLGGVSIVVLDEADEMLDMGFAEDMEALLGETPDTRQTMLFSATIPPRIAAIAAKHMTNPVEVRAVEAKLQAGEGPKVRQTAYLVPRAYKLAALGRVLDLEAPAAAIVFCRTRIEVDSLTETLAARGYRPEALHGGMSQEQRDRVMRLFRAGTADLLIATDVAARGLDIEHLTHVVNFHVPNAAESYVHRIGRVGRAGREGVAVTLAEPREHFMLRNIERATGQRIDVTQVPTVADLKTRRLELTRAALQEKLREGDLDHYRVVVEALAGEFDIMDIAMAAVKMAHEAEGAEDEEEEDIPAVRPGKQPRENFDVGNRPRGGRTPHRAKSAGMTRIFIGGGRDAGIGPRDLVGAIANEAGLSGRDIGSIDIADRFALVEVPTEAADQVIEALRLTRIKGRKYPVRRDRAGEA